MRNTHTHTHTLSLSLSLSRTHSLTRVLRLSTPPPAVESGPAPHRAHNSPQRVVLWSVVNLLSPCLNIARARTRTHAQQIAVGRKGLVYSITRTLAGSASLSTSISTPNPLPIPSPLCRSALPCIRNPAAYDAKSAQVLSLLILIPSSF
jgi:hypothetical protein